MIRTIIPYLFDVKQEMNSTRQEYVPWERNTIFCQPELSKVIWNGRVKELKRKTAKDNIEDRIQLKNQGSNKKRAKV